MQYRVSFIPSALFKLFPRDREKHKAFILQRTSVRRARNEQFRNKRCLCHDSEKERERERERERKNWLLFFNRRSGGLVYVGPQQRTQVESAAKTTTNRGSSNSNRRKKLSSKTPLLFFLSWGYCARLLTRSLLSISHEAKNMPGGEKTSKKKKL